MANLSVCAAVMVVILMLGERSSSACCINYDRIRPPQKAMIYYVVQEITELCDIKAIIFQTVIPKTQGKRIKPLCADPESPWVRRAMETVPSFDQWKKKMI